MNAKILTVVVGLLMLVPAGYAANERFGSCPSGYDCEETPDGEPFPPDAVTGHTVYAKFVMERNVNEANSLGLPTDFAAVAGYFEIIDRRDVREAVQRECVVWFNGKNLDQRPAGDEFGWGSENAFPSDEDESPPADQSNQDYDFDRDVDTCLPRVEGGGGPPEYYAFAVVVEKGDCNPGSARQDSFRFRGHLDFVDPNNIYHEVQEYDYVCNAGKYAGVSVPGNGIVPTGAIVSDAVADLFPNTGTDPNNFNGCSDYYNPTGAVDPGADTGNVDPDDPNNATAPSADPSVDQNGFYFDFGHKCNGSVRDLFTERLWITPIHEPIWDATIQEEYTFALQVDTCSGMNIHEGIPVDPYGLVGRGPGKWSDGENNSYDYSENDPGDSWSSGDNYGWTGLVNAHDVDAIDYTLDGLGLGQPLVEVCHDGSSFSFDDTPRGRTTHDGPPAGEEEIMRGNSYDANATSTTFGKHRQNCRVNYIDWPYNDHPGKNDAQVLGLIPGSEEPRGQIGEDCYPEDHKTAQIDIYVFDADPTGLFLANSNGLTGANAYVEGESTGPNYPFE